MVVVVDGDSGCVWRLWCRVVAVVVVVEVVGGGSGGGLRMVVQIVMFDDSGLRWLWLWVEAVMMADSSGSGV